MNTERKTDRTYGAVVALIRRVASRRRTFTRAHLPGLSARQATDNLRDLIRRGELVKVRAASQGCRPRLAVFQQTRC